MADESIKNLIRARFIPFVFFDAVIDRSLKLARSVRLWIGILVVFGGLIGAVAGLLWIQGATSAAFWTLVVLAGIVTYWALIALYAWSNVGWVRRLNALIILSGGFGLVIAMMKAAGFDTEAHVLTMVYLSIAGFMVGVNLLRLLLLPSHPILGVARTMIEEALRIRIAVVIIVAYLVVLALLPLALGSEDRVTYMVQRFLVYALFVASALLGVLTVLLGAYSVSLELSSRQAHMTLTKPLARWQYLLGKWLGIVMLNAVLVAVAGVAIYGFTLGIARNPALNDFDRYAVDREVLTARLAMSPSPVNTTWDEMFDNVLREKQARDPDKFGEVGEPIGSLPTPVQQEVIAEAVGAFYTIDGGESKSYRFEGLSDAVSAAERSIKRGEAILRERAGLSAAEAQQYVQYVVGRTTELEPATIDKVSMEVFDELARELESEKIQLVLTTDTSPEPDDQFVEFYLKINGQPFPRPMRLGDPLIPVSRGEVPVESPHEVGIPASMIGSDGSLVVEVSVPSERIDGTKQAYVQFSYKDSQMQLFYRVGSFEANLARAMVIVWLKLCFLAMLGLCAGALLSFPVAAILGIVVFIAASFSGVISDSLSSYAAAPDEGGAWAIITGTVSTFFGHLGEGNIYDAFRLVIRLIGELFMLLIPSFGSFGVTDPLSNGQVIGTDTLIAAVLKIGVLWTGVVGLLGLLLFQRREIARVTV